jgi:hypothetical protein
MSGRINNLILGVATLVLIGEIITLIFIKRDATLDNNVLSEATSIATPTPSVVSTPTPTPTPTSTPRPTPVKTPTPVPQPKFTSQEINGFIDRFGGQYGVSPDVLRYIALCESGFDPFAKKLSYVGLFQFGPATWQNLRSEMGEDKDVNLRANAEEAVQTAAYAISIGKKGIWPNCYP